MSQVSAGLVEPGVRVPSAQNVVTLRFRLAVPQSHGDPIFPKRIVIITTVDDFYRKPTVVAHFDYHCVMAEEYEF